MTYRKKSLVFCLSFLAGCAILPTASAAGVNLGMLKGEVIKILDTLGITTGGVYSPVSGWVGTATSALDMGGFPITNVDDFVSAGEVQTTRTSTAFVVNSATGRLCIGGTLSTHPALRYGSAAGTIEFVRADGSAGATTFTAASGLTIDGAATISGVTSATVSPSVSVWSSASGVTLTASQVSGHVYTNEGSVTSITPMTLPAAAAGLHATWIVQDVQGFKIIAQAGDTIRISGAVSASGGYVAATAIGSTVHLVAINATEWVAVGGTGTWATDDETP